jgi:hypothetical protein
MDRGGQGSPNTLAGVGKRFVHAGEVGLWIAVTDGEGVHMVNESLTAPAAPIGRPCGSSNPRDKRLASPLAALDSGAQSDDESGDDDPQLQPPRVPVAFLRYLRAELHRPLTID